MTTCIDPQAATDCRSRLLQAACEVFSTEGYRAGVDRIAAHAGVAKQTLYNHFPSKAELFGEVIRQATDEFMIALDDTGEGLRDRLIRFGIRYRERLLAPAGLGLYRMLVAETPRFPELAAAFYKTGPQRTAVRLGTVLEEAVRRGELRAVDAEFAAAMLLSMLVGVERSHLLFGCGVAPTPELTVQEKTTEIVDCFLRAFSPDRT